MPPLIADLALILGVAAVVTFIFQKIRQPVVLGYIVAGFIVGPYTPTLVTVSDLPNIKTWAELGVIFLMFSLGLEFTFRKLARVGVAAGGTALVEVILMVLIGYAGGKWLGWSNLDSLFLGGILSISSTTIIIKAFDELGLKSRRFAEVVFGVLIVEDLVAILLLVGLSTVAINQTFFSVELLLSALQLVFVVGSWFLVGFFVIPSFFKYAAKHLSDESLTILSASLCLLLVVLATRFHYSAALGAFIMGSILAETGESHRIESLMRPLRDLFAAVFFVSVGMLVNPQLLWEQWDAVVIISLLTIFGKIASTTIGALLTGQPLKRSVQIGFSLAQIGEFSFIIASLGASLKVTSDFLYPLAVAVSVVTTFTTPYFISISEKSAALLDSLLPTHVSHRLHQFSSWSERRGGRFQMSIDMRGGLQFLLNGILVTLFFTLASRFAAPLLDRFVTHSGWVAILQWVASILLSAPFVWGMFFAFRPQDKPPTHTDYPVVLFFSQAATVLWVGILSAVSFPTGLPLLLTAISAFVIFIILYQRLERSYRWFEDRLLDNLKGPKAPPHSLLAPWDLHLIKITVHQNSELAGRSIEDSQIRTRYGLNIVAIQRGLQLIGAPGAKDVLFPGDDLLVLGTDEQIDLFKTSAQTPRKTADPVGQLSDYSLNKLFVESDSPFKGQSIRDSGIREALKGLVVGLERGTSKTINPDPALVLKEGDLLWIVSGGIASGVRPSQ